MTGLAIDDSIVTPHTMASTVFSVLEKHVHAKSAFASDIKETLHDAPPCADTDMSTDIADSLWLLQLQKDVAESDHDIAKVVTAVMGAGVLPVPMLLERLELKSIRDPNVNQVLDAEERKWPKTFNQRFTNLHFVQHKFNLLREDVGYARMISELHFATTTPSRPNPATLRAMLGFLVGHFSLDPNRVVDVILELALCNLTCSEMYLELLSSVDVHPKTLAYLLSLKLDHALSVPLFDPSHLHELLLTTGRRVGERSLSTNAVCWTCARCWCPIDKCHLMTVFNS